MARDPLKARVILSGQLPIQLIPSRLAYTLSNMREKDRNDYAKAVKFVPIGDDPAMLRELAESTHLRGAVLIRHALAELLRNDRIRRARERRRSES
jgi:hypothetical protein